MTDHVLEETYKIGAGETDPTGCCRPSALQGFLQDVATLHAEFLEVSRESLLARAGVFWVLLRNWYTLSRPIAYGEQVCVRTWHRGAQGAQLYRDFDIEVDGVRVGEATTAWVVLDWESRRMVRPSLVHNLDATRTHTRAKQITLGKLKAPESLALVEEFRATYRDLDINNHVNNVVYTDIVCNALHLDARPDAYLAALQVCFVSQVVSGETLKLYTGAMSDGRIYVTGRDAAGAARFEAAATLAQHPSFSGL